MRKNILALATGLAVTASLAVGQTYVGSIDLSTNFAGGIHTAHIAVDDSGANPVIYVTSLNATGANTNVTAVKITDPLGTPVVSTLDTNTGTGTGAANTRGYGGVAVDAAGNVFVAWTGNGNDDSARLRQYDSSGTLIGEWLFAQINDRFGGIDVNAAGDEVLAGRFLSTATRTSHYDVTSTNTLTRTFATTPGTSTAGNPRDVAYDPKIERVYINTNGILQRITPATTTTIYPASSWAAGSSADLSAAVANSFAGHGVGVSASGGLIGFTPSQNAGVGANTARIVSPSGALIYTLGTLDSAGTGTTALLSRPTDLAFFTSGGVHYVAVADTNLTTIDRVAIYSLAAEPTDGDVVINEFAYDDSSTDTAEFVELYNRETTATINIGGWTLVGIDLAPTADSTATIPANTLLAPGDFYVLGMIAGVPNVDQDITANADFQNDMEALALRNGSSVLKDSVVYERNKGNVIIPAGLGEPAFDGVSATSGGGYWANTTTVDLGGVINTGGDPSFGSFTVGRVTDGQDTGNNSADFIAAVASPGKSNNSNGTVSTYPYVQNFDSVSSGTYLFDLAGVFVSVRASDPAIAETPGVGAVNPNVIPASPQGGNVGTMWDSSGGGNMVILNMKEPKADLQVETYVYVETTPLSGADTETWAIVIGGSDMLYNTGTFNGDYGVRALYVRNSTGATITLQEAANGVATNIGSPIAIASSGWYRLLMQVRNNGETGLRIGGSFGDNGASATGSADGVTTLNAPTLLSMGYREGIATGVVGAQPLTLDGLNVRISAASLATPSSVDEWSILND